MRQYLGSCLQPDMFFSMPVEETGGIVGRFFQVLIDIGDAVCHRPHLPRRGPRAASEGVQSAEVLHAEEPACVDILGLCGGVTGRQRCFAWLPQASDVES